MIPIRRILPIILIIPGLTGASLAQKKAPRFDEFPVARRSSGKPSRLNLGRHAQARKFRTMLKDIAKKGANFAGHYAIGYWGCGTECLRIGIVNLRTGQAYVSPFYASVGIAYRADSRLLIVAPPEQIRELYGDDAPEYLHPRYYVLRGNKLVLVYPDLDKRYEAETYWN